ALKYAEFCLKEHALSIRRNIENSRQAILTNMLQLSLVSYMPFILTGESIIGGDLKLSFEREMGNILYKRYSLFVKGLELANHIEKELLRSGYLKYQELKLLSKECHSQIRRLTHRSALIVSSPVKRASDNWRREYVFSINRDTIGGYWIFTIDAGPQSETYEYAININDYQDYVDHKKALEQISIYEGFSQSRSMANFSDRSIGNPGYHTLLSWVFCYLVTLEVTFHLFLNSKFFPCRSKIIYTPRDVSVEFMGTSFILDFKKKIPLYTYELAYFDRMDNSLSAGHCTEPQIKKHTVIIDQEFLWYLAILPLAMGSKTRDKAIAVLTSRIKDVEEVFAALKKECVYPEQSSSSSSPVVLAHSSWLIAHSPSATSYQLRAKVSSSPLAADGLTKASRGSLWSPVEQSRTKSSELRAKSSSPVNRLAEPAKLPTVWDIYAYRHEISEQFLYIKFCIKEKTDSEDYAFELDQLALELFVLLFDIEEQKDSPDIMLERLKEKLQQLDNLLINLETPGAVETKHHRATLRLRKIINNMLIGMSSRVKVRRTDIMPILLKEIAEMSDSDPKKLFIQYPKELIADVDVKVFSQALIELIEGGWIKEGIAVISVSQLSNEALIDITINLEEKNINADDIDVEDDKEFLKGLSGDYKITGDAKECGAVIHQMIKANGGAVEIINFNKELKIRFRLPSSISPNTTGEYNVVQAKAVLGRLGGHDIGFHTALSQIFAQNINEINYNLAREFRIDAKIRKVVNEMPGEWLDLDNTLSSLQLELEHGDNLETMIKSKLPVAVIEYITEKIIKALEDGDFFTEVFLTKVLFPESELSERLMDFCKNNKGLVSSPVVQDRTKSSEIRAKNSSPEEEQIGRIIVRLLPYSSTQITSDLIGKFQVFLLGINFAEFQRQATELENNDVDGWEGLIKRFIDVAYPYLKTKKGIDLRKSLVLAASATYPSHNVFEYLLESSLSSRKKSNIKKFLLGCTVYATISYICLPLLRNDLKSEGLITMPLRCYLEGHCIVRVILPAMRFLVVDLSFGTVFRDDYWEQKGKYLVIKAFQKFPRNIYSNSLNHPMYIANDYGLIPDINLNLGAAYDLLGKHQEALVEDERAITLNPEYPMAYIDIGDSYCELHRYNDAVTVCQRAIDLSLYPVPMAYYNLGLAYRGLSEYERAISAFRRAKELDSTLEIDKILVKLKRLIKEKTRLVSKPIQTAASSP
ncbi:MAG: tetratricopeptide repeat protein, partial [Candidatus Omnitrophica bacterium]|nr:tetratricopeptide repeat protein [Candidatus Omnitrophota bacterium]